MAKLLSLTDSNSNKILAKNVVAISNTAEEILTFAEGIEDEEEARYHIIANYLIAFQVNCLKKAYITPFHDFSEEMGNNLNFSQIVTDIANTLDFGVKPIILSMYISMGIPAFIDGQITTNLQGEPVTTFTPNEETDSYETTATIDYLYLLPKGYYNDFNE